MVATDACRRLSRTAARVERVGGARVAQPVRASRTLDPQYNLIQGDTTGKTLLRAARGVARRGVRVRTLVDDLYTDTSEQLLLDLSATPNVEARRFNPFPAGRTSALMKCARSLDDFSRLNHRMLLPPHCGARCFRRPDLSLGRGLCGRLSGTASRRRNAG